MTCLATLYHQAWRPFQRIVLINSNMARVCVVRSNIHFHFVFVMCFFKLADSQLFKRKEACSKKNFVFAHLNKGRVWFLFWMNALQAQNSVVCFVLFRSTLLQRFVYPMPLVWFIHSHFPRSIERMRVIGKSMIVDMKCFCLWFYFAPLEIQNHSHLDPTYLAKWSEQASIGPRKRVI